MGFFRENTHFGTQSFYIFAEKKSFLVFVV